MLAGHPLLYEVPIAYEARSREEERGSPGVTAGLHKAITERRSHQRSLSRR